MISPHMKLPLSTIHKHHYFNDKLCSSAIKSSTPIPPNAPNLNSFIRIQTAILSLNPLTPTLCILQRVSCSHTMFRICHETAIVVIYRSRIASNYVQATEMISLVAHTERWQSCSGHLSSIPVQDSHCDR